MKSKLIFGLLAMTLILAFASASFAQINLQIFSSPSAAESLNKRTAQTADPLSTGGGVTVSGGVIANAELTTTIITLTYGAPITSTCGIASASCPGNATQAAVPAADSIRIVAATGLFANVTINTIRYSAGTIDIVLPECKNTNNEPGVGAVGGVGPPSCSAATPSGSFRIVGVRSDVNGKTAPMTVSATLNNGGNNYILTRVSDTTISALSAPFAALTGATTIATVFTNGTPVLNCAVGTTACGTVKLTEGYASAWRPTGQPGNSTTNGLTAGADQIVLIVSGLATGQTLTVTASTTASLTLAAAAGQTFSGTAGGVTTLAYNVTASSLTAVESATFTFTVGTVGTAPLTPANISVTFKMGPIAASALDANGVPTAVNGYPVYADANAAGPVTIETIVPAQTTMLIPFAVFGGGYDTGIAIANTTADPFGGTALGSATPQSGTITFDFFPQLATGGAGTASTVTTSATIRPVTGLSADGTLAAGGSYTVLLSNLLPLATPPITGSFTGYVFVRTNFLDAHGVFYPTNFAGFTAGSEMLVLSQPISTPRTGTEQLNN